MRVLLMMLALAGCSRSSAKPAQAELVVGSLEDTPLQLWIDDDNVYFSGGIKGLSVVAKKGGAAKVVVEDLLDVSVSGNWIYGADHQKRRVLRMPKSGGQRTVLEQWKKGSRGSLVASGDDWAIVNDKAFVRQDIEFALWSNAQRAFKVAAPPRSHLRVLDGQAIWGYTDGDNQLFRVDRATGTLTNLAEVTRPTIALDETNLYFATSYGKGGLGVVPKAGGTPRFLIEGHASDPVLDGGSIYYYDDQGLVRIAKNGGEATRVLPQEGVTALTADREHLYFATEKAIYRVLKPRLPNS
jgi:hypothetical protein